MPVVCIGTEHCSRDTGHSKCVTGSSSTGGCPAAAWPLGRAGAQPRRAEPHAEPRLSSGRGRFGQVHKCEEKATGLKLAAKIIKTRGAKDKVGPGVAARAVSARH